MTFVPGVSSVPKGDVYLNFPDVYSRLVIILTTMSMLKTFQFVCQ